MCSPELRKQANRFNWMVKGSLIDISESDATVERIYNSYFKRLWGNHENVYKEAGFDVAYAERLQNKQMLDYLKGFNDDMDKIAVLGYD